jgi:hypothetical protein
MRNIDSGSALSHYLAIKQKVYMMLMDLYPKVKNLYTFLIACQQISHIVSSARAREDRVSAGDHAQVNAAVQLGRIRVRSVFSLQKENPRPAKARRG